MITNLMMITLCKTDMILGRGAATLHDNHLEQSVSRPAASNRNEVDLLKRRGSSEDDEPKRHINDNDIEEQMSFQRCKSGDTDSDF